MVPEFEYEWPLSARFKFSNMQLGRARARASHIGSCQLETLKKGFIMVVLGKCSFNFEMFRLVF